VANGENPGARAERGAPTPRARQTSSRRQERTGLREFIRECWAELQRVQWPDRVQLWQATAVVIIVCVVIGAYIAALDSVLARLSHWLINQYSHSH
jgi:preprotein translocase SecE subunit